MKPTQIQPQLMIVKIRLYQLKWFISPTQTVLMPVYCIVTGVARNFDWKRPIMEKSCNVSLMTFFGDVKTITSQKLRHICFLSSISS